MSDKKISYLQISVRGRNYRGSLFCSEVHRKVYRKNESYSGYWGWLKKQCQKEDVACRVKDRSRQEGKWNKHMGKNQFPVRFLFQILAEIQENENCR